MTIDFTEQDGKTYAAIAGRVDAVTADTFKDELLTHLQAGGTLVLDCAQLNYISSAGLRSLFILAKTAAAKQVEVKLYRPNNFVREILELSGFDSFFEVTYDEDM